MNEILLTFKLADWWQRRLLAQYDDEFLPLPTTAHFIFVLGCLCSIKFPLWITKSSIIIINNGFINTQYSLSSFVCALYGCELWLVSSIGYTPKHVAYTSLMWYFKKNWNAKSIFAWKENVNTSQNYPPHERECVNSLVFPQRLYLTCHIKRLKNSWIVA